MSVRDSAHATRGRDSAFTQARRREYADELIDDYVSWHEACDMVAEAYESWSCAERQDRPLAFGLYVSALDREERAATAYQAAVARLAAAA
jgi:hypothetical protein